MHGWRMYDLPGTAEPCGRQSNCCSATAATVHPSADIGIQFYPGARALRYSIWRQTIFNGDMADLESPDWPPQWQLLAVGRERPVLGSSI